YHRALDLVERSLTAHGGVEPIETAGGFRLCQEGSFDLATRLQGRSSLRPEPTPIAECTSYDAKAGRVGYDINWFNYYSSNQDLREVYDAVGRVLFIDKRNRNGGWLPIATVADSRERLLRMLPNMLLADALEQRTTLRWAGERRVDGRPLDIISYTTSAGDTLSIAIDRQTLLVSSVTTLFEMPLLGDTEIEWRWSDFTRSDEGLTVPGHLVVSLGGTVMKDVRLSTVLGADATDFEAPEGVTVEEPPDAIPPLSEFVPYGERPPIVETLAPQVHMVTSLRPGFGLLFVEFEKFVLAVDAPTGWYEMNQLPPMNWSHGDSIAALGKKYLRAIRQTVPGKPVRYVALTHHHSDHIGGLRAFTEAGATLLAGETAARMARLAVESPATLSGDDWDDADPGSVDIDVVRGERVIADASMEVRLIELPDGNPKADNYLMVYLPKQKLLYATAFIYPVPEAVFPPKESIPLSRYFVDWLDNSGLEIERVYNLHAMRRVEEWQLEKVRGLAGSDATKN
ncbi:MAG: MBL fold metallo-hydrolase, partial [Pseudomonadota bacterium]